MKRVGVGHDGDGHYGGRLDVYSTDMLAMDLKVAINTKLLLLLFLSSKTETHCLGFGARCVWFGFGNTLHSLCLYGHRLRLTRTR